MRWTDEHLFKRILARDASLDGQVLTGVRTTGIYCLPSCGARKPLPAHVQFFPDEASARRAGFRPCLRCRPDVFYRGEDPDLMRLEQVLNQAAVQPAAFPDIEALAEWLGVGVTKLKALFRAHVQGNPSAFLQRQRIRAASDHLAAGRVDLDGLGFDCGYQSASGFHAAFRRQTGLSPGAYRTMLGSDRFVLPLPAGLRVGDVLAFHGRDPLSLCEQVSGTGLRKAFLCRAVPSQLSLAFQHSSVEIQLAGARGPQAMAAAHRATLRLLGWAGAPGAFESAHPELARGRAGLRVLLTLEPFEALVWAIVGQQVNLAFAYALRRDLVQLTGLPAPGGLVAHPDASRLASLGVEELQAIRFSRRKAEYLLHAAREVASGSLDLGAFHTATGARRRLLGLRGCGPWTAQYVLMRGLGFPDALPLGDAGLTLALQRWFRLEQRPDTAETERLMAAYAPHRSLATFHLWASLKGTPA